MPRPVFPLVRDIVIKSKNTVQVIFEKEYSGDVLHSVLLFSDEEYNKLTPSDIEQLKDEKFKHWIQTGTGGLPFPENAVPWGPSDLTVSRMLLEAANIQSSDIVCDVGCGDGRVLTDAVEQYHVNAVGVDLNPFNIETAQKLADEKNLHDQILFLCQDALVDPLPVASIYYFFQLETFMDALEPKLKSMPVGTRIVSKRFNFTTGWVPDKIINCGTETGFVWIVR